MYRTFLIVSFLCLISIPLSPITYNSIRCGTYLIDLGASRYEVLKKCGEPNDIQKSNFEVVKHQRYIISSAKSTYRGWMYDMYTTTLSLNVNRDEKYRFGEKHDHASIFTWLPPEQEITTYTFEGFTVQRTIAVPSFTGGPDWLEWRCVQEKVERERYLYNLGGTRFLRYLTFENGSLVKIDTGEYGF